MYTAMRNHLNTFNFILDTIEDQNKNFDTIVKDNVDKHGKSFLHYIVNPIPYGSYENAEMLTRAIEVGFKTDHKDRLGKTPYDYACEQQSGVLKKIYDDIVFKKPKF